MASDQLGHGETKDVWEPTRMVGRQLEGKKVVKVSGGGQHTCIIAEAFST